MKRIKKIDVKKSKLKVPADQKAREQMSQQGEKAVAGCPEIKFTEEK
jgi:hypothetical protein